MIAGDYSVRRSGTGFKACWPERKGRIVVWLRGTTSVYDWMLHIGYLWSSPASTITVRYGGVPHQLAVRPGLHSAYLGVSGAVTSFAVTGLGGGHMCVAGAEAGQLVAYGPAIP